MAEGLRAKAVMSRMSAARKYRQVAGRVGRQVFVALRVAVVVLSWLVMILSRCAVRALGGLGRWVLRHPRSAICSAAVIAIAVPGFLFIAPTPPGDLSGFDDSLACLAQNIYHEARGEPMLGQIAVAKVVMNRVDDHRFPGDVCAVIRQGGEWPHHTCQFSWWCDGQADAILDQRAMSEIHPLARDVLLGHYDDPTDGAMWYHAKRVTPAWRRDFAEGPTIGNHIFYRTR